MSVPLFFCCNCNVFPYDFFCHRKLQNHFIKHVKSNVLFAINFKFPKPQVLWGHFIAVVCSVPLSSLGVGCWECKVVSRFFVNNSTLKWLDLCDNVIMSFVCLFILYSVQRMWMFPQNSIKYVNAKDEFWWMVDVSCSWFTVQGVYITFHNSIH